MQPQYVENTRNQAAISIRSDKEGLAAIQGVVTSSTAPVAKTKKKKSGAKSLGRVATDRLPGSAQRHPWSKKIFFLPLQTSGIRKTLRFPGFAA